jgi:hypothetical protein
MVFKNIRAKLKKGSSSSEKNMPDKATSVKILPARILWREGQHEDKEQITLANDLFDAVVPIWKGLGSNPNAMNGGTGKLFHSSHHVKGGAAKSKRDFQQLTLAFCLEFIWIPHEGQKYRVRCLNQFSMKSN